METSFEGRWHEDDNYGKLFNGWYSMNWFTFMDMWLCRTPAWQGGQDIHVQLKMNGKETPKESFEKYTGHMFLKQLKKSGDKLSDYKTEQKDRNLYLLAKRSFSDLNNQ